MSINPLFADFLADASIPASAPAVPFTIPTPGKVTHKLTLRKGRAKNFRSIGNEFLEIDYQRNNATLITSDDNGAGKSTMLVWLPIFVLFNDTYSKREKKAGLVNSTSRKDCVGEIEFFTKGVEWKVRRGIKPDLVEVYQQVDGDWKQVENDAAKSDTNKYIMEILGVDQKMFENSLVLGKEKYIPFSEMMTADRRLMVETIWDLGFFTVMNEDVKVAIKGILGKLAETDRLRALAENSLNSERVRLEQIESSNELLKQNSQDALVSAEGLLATMESDINGVSTQITESEKELVVLVDKKETIATEVRQTGQEEIDELVTSYDQPLADQEADNFAKIKTAQTQLDDKKSSRSEFVERKEKLLDQKVTLNEELTTAVDSLKVSNENKAKGQNFKVRFETELEGHQTAIKRFHDMGECPTCTQIVSESTKDRISQEYQPKINDVTGRMDLLSERIQILSSEIETFEATIGEIKTRMVPVDDALTELQFETREYEQQVSRLETDLINTKTAGERSLQQIKDAMANRVNDLKREIERRVVLSTESVDQQISSKNDLLSRLKASKGTMTSNIMSHQTYIKELKAKLAVEPTPTQGVRDNIAGLETQLEELEQLQIQLDNSRQDHEHLLYLLRDDQTKARIVAMYLPFLNSKVNEYLEGLNMFLHIQIDDKFEISMNSPDRKGQSIFSLSTGQRARLNLAIMWALRDVANLKASIQCNILVMDEILENLSERGVQECIMLINNKFKGNNLFVVSQREQEFQEYFEHNIRYGLRNGMTTVIDKN